MVPCKRQNNKLIVRGTIPHSIIYSNSSVWRKNKIKRLLIPATYSSTVLCLYSLTAAIKLKMRKAYVIVYHFQYIALNTLKSWEWEQKCYLQYICELLCFRFSSIILLLQMLHRCLKTESHWYSKMLNVLNFDEPYNFSII